MAEKKVAARSQVVAKLAYQLFLGFPVEVDDDVAAEDDILHFGQPEVVIHEVEAAEGHHVPQIRGDAHHGVALVFAFQQILN